MTSRFESSIGQWISPCHRRSSQAFGLTKESRINLLGKVQYNTIVGSVLSKIVANNNIVVLERRAIIDETGAGILTNFVAVWITVIASPRVFLRLLGLVLYLTYCCATALGCFGNTFAKLHKVGQRCNQPIWRPEDKTVVQKVQASFTRGSRVLFMLLALLWCGAIVASIVLSQRLVLDPLAMPSNATCEALFYDASLGVGQPDDVLDKSENYYVDCYDPANPDASVEKCTVFSNTDLPVIIMNDAACPFSNTSRCLLGANSAVTFDTGLLSPAALGVNSASSVRVRRTTSCAPVDTQGLYSQTLDPATNNTKITWTFGVVGGSFRNQTRNLAVQAIFIPTGIELKALSEIFK